MSVGASELSALIQQMERASAEELPRLWKEYLEGPAPAYGVLCRQLLAWKLQARLHGGASYSLRSQLQALDRAYDENREYRPAQHIKRGTEFVRLWKGTVHRVKRVDTGFEYEGAVYPTLSVIARRITGTRWSGPRFFGWRNGSETA